MLKNDKLPTILIIEEVSEILAAAPGPGLKYRAALSISCGAGLRASQRSVIVMLASIGSSFLSALSLTCDR